MARGVRNPNKPPILRTSPLTGQKVPQAQYRRELAQVRGFASTRQLVKATQEQKQAAAQALQHLPTEQRGRVAAELATYLQQHPQGLGSFIEGGERKSNQLPPALLNYIRSLGNAQYPIWRLLYANR